MGRGHPHRRRVHRLGERLIPESDLSLMKMKAPTTQFCAALVSYTGAVGLALSLDPTLVQGDMRGAVPRLACLALLWLGNYIEARQTAKHPPDNTHSDSALRGLHATLAVAIAALVPLGLDTACQTVQTEDLHPAVTPVFTVFLVIVGFVAYYQISKFSVRHDNPRQPRPSKPKKRRSTTQILVEVTVETSP